MTMSCLYSGQDIYIHTLDIFSCPQNTSTRKRGSRNAAAPPRLFFVRMVLHTTSACARTTSSTLTTSRTLYMYVGLDGSDPRTPNIWKDTILYISLVVAYLGTMHGSHTVPYSLSATLLCHALGLLHTLTLVARLYLAFVLLSCCIYSRCRVATHLRQW